MSDDATASNTGCLCSMVLCIGIILIMLGSKLSDIERVLQRISDKLPAKVEMPQPAKPEGE